MSGFPRPRVQERALLLVVWSGAASGSPKLAHTLHPEPSLSDGRRHGRGRP